MSINHATNNVFRKLPEVCQSGGQKKRHLSEVSNYGFSVEMKSMVPFERFN